MTGFQIEAREISRSFGEVVALHGLSLGVPRGTYVVLLGPSGSGKTTLLSILAGFTPPSTGSVLIDEQDVTGLPPAKRPTTTVFQDYALFPHMSVARNIGFGLRMRGIGRSEEAARVAAALDLVGLAGFGTRGIHELSGGQRQRIAVARALVVEPKVLLLDEPLGALDLALRRQMQDELKAIQRRTGTTFIHVTHDQDEAMNLADMLVVMDHGRISDQGPPERVYRRPRSRFAASFMGETNLIEGVVTGHTHGHLTVETALGAFACDGEAPEGARVHLSIRPELISADSAPAGNGRLPLGTATVLERAFAGTHARVTARIEETTLLLRLAVDADAEAGAKLSLSVAPSDVVVLSD